MLYVYQIDITSTMQTLDTFQQILQSIFLEIHHHIHKSHNRGNQYTILTNENTESTPFSALVQSKLDAMRAALAWNPHISASITVQSLFAFPVEAELLRMTQRDRSLLMTLYYGMHSIAIQRPYMEPIRFALYGVSVEMSSILRFFLIKHSTTNPTLLIPYGMMLELKPLYEHHCLQILGIGLAHERYLAFMQMMMAPYMDTSQSSIDLCQELMRFSPQHSPSLISTPYPGPISPDPCHPSISRSSYLFFQPCIGVETIPGDHRARERALHHPSAPPPTLHDDDQAAVDALLSIRASNYQPESSARASDVPSSSARVTPIDLDNTEEVDRWAAENNFTYIHDVSSTFSLMIDRVAVLGPCEKLWGVYTKQPIHVGSRLGEYKGDRVHLTDDITNLDYIFILTPEDTEEDTTEAIDAREKRNWTAFVNTASSFETANVEAFVGTDSETHLPSIFYKSSRPIAAGDQLLIYYGDDYVLSKIRYLNPKNNALESSQIFTNNEKYYLTEAKILPIQFVRLFNLPEQQLFKAVCFSRLLSEESSCQIKRSRRAPKEKREVDSQLNVDLPFLALRRKENDHDAFFPQKDQENITTLMLACWFGDLEMIDFLLRHHANPNLQSSIQGLYALHIIVASEASFDVKKAMFHLFYAQERTEKTYLHLQDQKNQTVLHWAIKKQDIKLIKFLLTLDREIQQHNMNTQRQNKKTLKSTLMNCIDDDNRDPFVLSLFLGLHDIAKELFYQTCHIDALGNYLKKESLDVLGSYMEEESIDLWVASLAAYKEKTGSIDFIASILQKIEVIDGYEPQKKLMRDLVSGSSTLSMGF